MFKRRNTEEDEFAFESFADDWDDELNPKAALPKGFLVALAVLIVVLLLSAATWGGVQMWHSSTPVYAAEEWVEAMWTLDSETVLERTCDQEVWVSNAIASGSSITGLLTYLDITQIPGLDEVVVPNVDLERLKREFEIDRSRIEFAEMTNDGETAVVTVQGQLRFRVFAGWYPYRLNETWLMVQEDNRWKWCGQHLPGNEEFTQ